jgi:hypothetical protein
VNLFQCLCKDYPVVLLLDSLDQLSDENKERSTMSFLHNMLPHKDCRIIVSALLDEDKYTYGCDTFLVSQGVPRVTIDLLFSGIKSPDLGEINSTSTTNASHNEARFVLESLLNKQSRIITETQHEIVMQSIVQEPSILYVKLASRSLVNLKSFEDLYNDVEVLFVLHFDDQSIKNILQDSSIFEK